MAIAAAMATLFQYAIAASSLLHPSSSSSSSSLLSPRAGLIRKTHLKLKLAVAGDDARRLSSRLMVKAEDEGNATAAAAVSEPSVVGEAATVLTKSRKPSPLQRGGTLAGEEAEEKEPSPATVGKSKPLVSESLGKFEDPRWRNGTWDIQQFSKDGKVNWDAVIDAEASRRKCLEKNPEASSNTNPVIFNTSIVPWWAWVKRFHLQEAELLNGRAAMIGFFAAYLVDSTTGVGLVDQTNSFLGKLLFFITIAGVFLIRKNEDIDNLKTLAKEWTFYDKQWQATWKDEQQLPVPEKENKASEKENKSSEKENEL
ncbi:hypothetical protein O6H91_Y494200 [Diphasiastrum complanatum]|nr:hypothetical protein O6H91_Y494200 [Diphasiastrum complanatum]